MTLAWHFVTSAGVYTVTSVTPSNSGNYLWAHKGNGKFVIQVPASGGASINNNAVGYGWFEGVATGVLPWRGPTICFRASGLNDLLTDNAYSSTAGLAGSNLDASVSSRSTYAGADTAGTTTLLGRLTGTRAGNLDNLDTNVGSRAAPGAAMALTSGERTTLCGQIDVALINQGDGADLLTAIADKIAQDWIAGDASPLAIVSALTANATFIQLVSDAAAAKTAAQALPNAAAIRADLDANSTKLARLDENVSAAKTLTAAYDRAKNAASKAELDAAQAAITTAVGTPMQAGTLVNLNAAYDRAKNAASKAELDAAQAALATAVGSPLQAGSYTAPPSAATIASTVLGTGPKSLAALIELSTNAVISDDGTLITITLNGSPVTYVRVPSTSIPPAKSIAPS
jgi:hypothetical protein